MDALSQRPREAVSFALHTLDDVRLAWDARPLPRPRRARACGELADRYEKVDPLAVVPIHTRAGARPTSSTPMPSYYRAAARQLAHLRALTRGTDRADEHRRADRRPAGDPPPASALAAGVRQGRTAVVDEGRPHLPAPLGDTDDVLMSQSLRHPGLRRTLDVLMIRT